jgi:hypothetical protein
LKPIPICLAFTGLEAGMPTKKDGCLFSPPLYPDSKLSFFWDAQQKMSLAQVTMTALIILYAEVEIFNGGYL